MFLFPDHFPPIRTMLNRLLRGQQQILHFFFSFIRRFLSHSHTHTSLTTTCVTNNQLVVVVVVVTCPLSMGEITTKKETLVLFINPVISATTAPTNYYYTGYMEFRLLPCDCVRVPVECDFYILNQYHRSKVRSRSLHHHEIVVAST